MFNLGMGEITIILMLALIFLGPKKLPELASGLGKLIREIRKTTADVKNEIQLDDAIRKPFEELREAVTLHPEELKRRDKLRKELAEIQKQAEEAVAAAEANMSQSPPEAPTAEGEGEIPGDGSSAPEGSEASESSDGPSDAGEAAPPFAAGGPASLGVPAPLHASSQASSDEALSAVTPAPVIVGPGVPGAAPAGTVARTPSGRVASSGAVPPSPPAPPLAAVLAKGTAAPVERRSPDRTPGGSDFLRSLRAVPEGSRSDLGRIPGRRTLPNSPGKLGPDENSAADRGNTTQALTEADLAAITVGPPPPPPAPHARPPAPPSPAPAAAAPTPAAASPSFAPLPPAAPQPAPPRLPGATPPKKKTSNRDPNS